MRNEGQSSRKIARTLLLSVTAVAKTVKRFEQTDTRGDQNRSGRQTLSSKSEKFIRVTSLQSRRLTAREIQAQLNATRSYTDVSRFTVQRRLTNAGQKGRIAANKPLLRVINRKKRLA